MWRCYWKSSCLGSGSLVCATNSTVPQRIVGASWVSTLRVFFPPPPITLNTFSVSKSLDFLAASLCVSSIYAIDTLASVSVSWEGVFCNTKLRLVTVKHAPFGVPHHPRSFILGQGLLLFLNRGIGSGFLWKTYSMHGFGTFKPKRFLGVVT